MRDWSHQERGVEQTRQSIATGHRRPIAVMGTGGGKSRYAGMVIESALQMGKKCLFIAHRRNLVSQFVNYTLAGVFGIDAGYIMADYDYVAGKSVYCGTVQTIAPRLQAGMMAGDMFQESLQPDIIFVDECHTGLNEQYQIIYNRFLDAIIIGLTATPCRPDGRGLGEVFDDIIDIASTEYLTDKKILTPVTYYVPDADGIDQIAGKGREYTEAAQDAVFNTPKIVGDSVDQWLKLAEDRQTILFAINVAHSKNLQRRFAEAGVVALHLDARSTDDERDEVFRKMQAGEAKIVCNVGLYVEGADVPDIWCIQLAFKSKSLVKVWQTCGRGARNDDNPPYDDLIVIDQGDNIRRLGPIDTPMDWSLDGKVRQRRKNNKKEKTFSVLLQCKSCTACFGGGKQACPRCGTELVDYGRDVETAEGQLVAAKPKKKTNNDLDIVEKIHMMSALKWYQQKKKYKVAWVTYKYKDIFKVSPPDEVKNCVAMEPEQGSFAQRQLKRIQIAAAHYRKKKPSAG